MKINIFTYVFWPEFFLVNDLVNELAGKGHEIAVQTSLPNYQTGSLAKGYNFMTGPYFENFGSAKIFRYPVVSRRKSFITLALNYLTNVIVGFFNLFRLPKADVYFFFATSPLLFILPVVLLKKLTKKPLVIWYQDLWPDSFFAVTGLNSKGLLGRIFDPFIKFIYNNTDLMLLQSPAFEENLKRYEYKGRKEVLYNWASHPKANENTPAWLSELPTEKFIVTFAGNIGKVQALNVVVEAAAVLQRDVSSVFFAIVGEGSFLPDLKKQVSELGLSNVGFYGRKSIDDMPALFEKSDALLVSLKGDPTFNTVVPSKVQAYMAAKKPLIAFLNGVGASIVEQAKCGVVITAEDKNAFVDKVKLLAGQTEAERLQMGLNGRNFFDKNFRQESAIQKLEGLLKEVTGIS